MDNLQSSKATKLNSLNLKIVPIRTFRITTISFFLCFFACFGIVPFSSALAKNSDATLTPTTNLYVQQSVSGTVFDENGQPLLGVSILEKGSENGTLTNFDGKFTISVSSESAILVFTYVGFEPQEINVKSNKNIKVVMKIGIDRLDEVQLVGSRNPSRVLVDSPVPVDVVDVKKLSSIAPQVNLNQMLAYVTPSFNSNTQTISDGTDHIDPASLRGLGPDQVLVLINGKRRHTSSLINVNGTFGRGNVGTDLNAIPAAAIKRIEVLRDGAAAQYGSDAIAGVINIVLNTSTDELTTRVTAGSYASKNANNQTGGFDGNNTNVNLNYGISLGKKGGYINFTGDFDYRDPYNRMKEWEGSIFNAYNAIEWQAKEDGADLSELPNNVSNIQKYGAQVPYFSSALKSSIAGAGTIADLQDVLNENVTDDELALRKQKRSDYNMRVGQSALRGGRFFGNFALPLDDNGTEVYAFGGMSARNGNSAGFYRLPNQSRTYTPLYINGFLPQINSKIKDQSLAIGIRGKVNGWNVDFSNTYGKNSFLYNISNTSNASLEKASRTRFDAGGYAFTQNTTALDVNRFFKETFNGLNLAFGLVHRFEEYEIMAGEEASYGKYNNGQLVVDPSLSASKDFFGSARAGGSQVFPGFKPANELARERTNVAAYFDVEADFTESLLVSFATRYENYSDFGSTTNFKLASRYKLTDHLNLRAAVNTGFRAPSLHQIYFNSTSTVFTNGQPNDVGTFSNDSKAAKLLGIPDLKQEKSKSASIGLTAEIPSLNLKITGDAFYVNIEDRVVYTGQFEGSGTGTEIDRLLSQANATKAAFFANAIDTDTKGIEVVITNKARLGTSTQLKSTLAGSFLKTERVGDIKASKQLKDAGLTSTYFNERSRLFLEESVPRVKSVLTNVLTMKKFNVFLRNTYFGETTEVNDNIVLQQEFTPKVITDLSFGYQITKPLTITVGANNLFDIYPDRFLKEVLDPNTGEMVTNRSGGRFDWSRSTQQFGVAGRYVFMRLSLVF